MANTNIDILDLQGLGTYDTKIKTEIGKKADDFVPIEYSEWLELTDAQKDEHNWKLLHVPDSGPEPPDVPDGKTVTPTDDVATWLECAGIDPTGFSELSDVLADSVTLQALMEDNNAVDYLVRSKSFIKSVALVPVMTSATTPSGEVIASTYYSDSYKPYFAFDDGFSTVWTPSSSDTINNAYIGYHFTSAVVVKKIKIDEGLSLRTTSFKVCGSNDGTNWTDIASINRTTAAGIYSITNTTAYSYYKIVITGVASELTNVMIRELQFYSEDGLCDNATAMSYIGLNNYAANTLLADETWNAAIQNSAYFESVDNVKVPTMTSNTTPSGVCESKDFLSGYPAYYAFDNDNDVITYWQSSANEEVGDYIRYKFAENPFKVYKFQVYYYTSVGNTYEIQGSNDNGTSWNTIITHTIEVADEQKKFIINPNDEYNAYQIITTSKVTSSDKTACVYFNIYGRKDV